jgi:FeS assembly SUF system regulator
LLCLTRKTDYALVAMADLAHQGENLSSAREIAERCGLPTPALTNILKQLTQFGLVSAARGPHGGYQLARDAVDITLVDLIEAVEGPARLTFCCDDESPDTDKRSCDIEQSCRIKGPVKRVHEGLLYVLRQVTLEQIACDDVPVGLGIEIGA